MTNDTKFSEQKFKTPWPVCDTRSSERIKIAMILRNGDGKILPGKLDYKKMTTTEICNLIMSRTQFRVMIFYADAGKDKSKAFDAFDTGDTSDARNWTELPALRIGLCYHEGSDQYVSLITACGIASIKACAGCSLCETKRYTVIGGKTYPQTVSHGPLLVVGDIIYSKDGVVSHATIPQICALLLCLRRGGIKLPSEYKKYIALIVDGWQHIVSTNL